MERACRSGSLVRDEATCDVDAMMITLSRCRPWSWTMDEGGYYAKSVTDTKLHARIMTRDAYMHARFPVHG
jgi:hypothetical protein